MANRTYEVAVMGKFLAILLALTMMLLGGCGGGGSGSGGNGSGGSGGTTIDVAGTWSITETSGANTCGDATGQVSSYQVDIAQSGGTLTVTSLAGTFGGTINNDTVSWTGSYSEQGGGTTTITGMSLTASSSGDSFSGSVNWSWTDGTDSCSGTTDVSGTKQVAPGPSVTDVSGTWAVTETSGTNTCGEPTGQTNSYQITVTQSGSALIVATPAGTFNGSISSKTVSWAGSFAEQGGTTTIGRLELTLSADSSSLSGSISWDWSDGIDSCSGTTAVFAVKQ